MFIYLNFLEAKVRRRALRWVISVTSLLVIWLLVASVVAFRLTRRPRAWFAEPAPMVKWGLLRSHRIQTRDGQEIGAWFADSLKGTPSVLVLHGNKGSRANSLSRAEMFASRGHAVLMISLRAHGDSTGDYHDVGF